MEIVPFITLAAVIIILAEVSYLLLKSSDRITFGRRSRPVLLDTSALIDGRIVTVAKTGFMNGQLIIPRSVVGELQFLADNADHDKRARARHGLDVVAELQAMSDLVQVEILQDGSKADEGVDERLLSLAKKYRASICTLDYNLNKVALVESITVLNINELAQSIRMAYLPGEKIHLELVQKGQDSHQAVGYLADGTMVVVEQASSFIGQTVEVEIIRSLQTAAGRMMFAKQLATAKKPPANRHSGEKLDGQRGKKSSNRSPKPSKRTRPVRQDPESKLISLVEETS